MQTNQHQYSRGMRIARAFLGFLIGCILAFGSAEAAFRYILFSDSEFALAQSAKIRQPHYFADADSDVDYFKLRETWSERDPQDKFNPRDPNLGWMHPKIVMPGYGHKFARGIGERRPFLFYGDSFTACVVPPVGCWEGLLAKTPLRDEIHTLNYGVAAYGFGQTNLMFEQSIDQYMSRKPIVAIGILVDNDLDRTIFDFRGCPKPLYKVESGELKVDLPGKFNLVQWDRENPISISSYIIRYLTHRAQLLPKSFEPPGANHPTLVAHKKALNLAILESLHSNLEARELDYFFVLFYGPKTWRKPGPEGWRETFITNSLDALGIPWVSTRKAMQASARNSLEETGKPFQRDYFYSGTGNKGAHFTEAGNRAALPAIIQGLLGEYHGLVKERDTRIEMPTTTSTIEHSQKQTEQSDTSAPRD